MNRLISLLALAAFAGPAAAQDMPLFTFTVAGEGWRKTYGESPLRTLLRTLLPPAPAAVANPSAFVLTRDGGTVYWGSKDGTHLWAFPVGPDGAVPASGAKYAALRLHKGEKSLAVTSLLTDSDGRIYAGTPDGIQVFDPTGRLSGVLVLPARGSPEGLAWEGADLVTWIGGQKFARKMNAKGPK